MNDSELTSEASTPEIRNVFVLMLENHSFDNIFAMSGIEGIRAASTTNSNTWSRPAGSQSHTEHVNDRAPTSMPTDPGHEFADVVQQLCNVKPCCPPGYKGEPDLCNNEPGCYKGGPYPAVNMDGFCENYATSSSEKTGLPADEAVGDVMACFNTARQLPVILKLAEEFAICDAWHSSMPGPTWPNRFFVHGGSSAGVSQSPTGPDEVLWETIKGFEFCNGSIFDALSGAEHKWRIYQDKHNDYSDAPSHAYQGGWISQAASLKGLSLLDIKSFRDFKADLNRFDKSNSPDYLDTPYTFIEPNFGASFFAGQNGFKGPNYKGGSSQHPEDNPYGGEGLIKAVYETIRNSPVWESSVLIVVYDEHGGFYDSVPPGQAVPPGDEVPKGHERLNEWKFDFGTYGVRVPAVVVSPYIPKKTVDHTLYDHTSVLATIQRILGMPGLTERDKKANDVRHLLSLKVPRTDCPVSLPNPAPILHTENQGPRRIGDAATEDSPIPSGSNIAGFLLVLLKTELELLAGSGESDEGVVERFGRLKTLGQAQAYVMKMLAHLEPLDSN